jgi:hypothetical protein
MNQRDPGFIDGSLALSTLLTARKRASMAFGFFRLVRLPTRRFCRFLQRISRKRCYAHALRPGDEPRAALKDLL